MAFKVNSTTVLGDDYKFTADKQYLSSPAGFIQIGGFQGLVAGYISGGISYPLERNTIDSFPFSTPFTTATDVGDLTYGRYQGPGQSSSKDGYTSGGATATNPNFVVNTIDKFPFSTPFTTATTAGSLSLSRNTSAAQSSEVNGYTSGGYNTTTPPVPSDCLNTIDRFPFSTPFTTATDVGDLSITRNYCAGHSSDINGYTSGGNRDFTGQNVIDRFPFSTPFTTATDTGDLSGVMGDHAGLSSSQNGYTAGNYSIPGPSIINRFPFSTPFTTATDIGDLANFSTGISGMSSLDYGYVSGERVPPTNPVLNDAITRFPFSTPFTTATDVGNLSQGRRGAGGHQY